MRSDAVKVIYNTVHSQTISNCGNFLFVGNNFGDIFVLSIHNLRALEENDSLQPDIQRRISIDDPKQVINVGSYPVTSLAFHRDFLIVGTLGLISGYRWNDEENQLCTKKNWEIRVPVAPEAVEATDVNHFWLDKTSDQLCVGCGDNMIYLINLDNGSIIRTFKGHKDYIHCVTGHENNIYSASEDGTILFWNSSCEKAFDKLEPHKNKNLMRPEMGKWQGTVSVNNDWLICGGGPKTSMWHLRTMECTTVLQYPGKAHVSGFLDDFMLIGGEHPFLQQYSFNGDLEAEIPISGSSAYSVVWQTEPFKFLSIGGPSNCLDICTNFNYRDLVLKLYKRK